MKDIEMIKTMFEMQMALDKAIYEGHGVEYNREKTRLALYDELGELVHELKADWCWWKKTCKPVDRAKVLEELVDCWHFAMSIDYHSGSLEGKLLLLETNLEGADTMIFRSGVMNSLSGLITATMNANNVVQALLRVTYNLGFSVEDVYWMYLTKNAENYERLRKGY